MAVQFPKFAVIVPAGTTPALPQKTALDMPALVVLRIRVRVPPGPSGFVGFALASGGTPYIPSTPGQWIVTDNEEIPWELDDAPDADTWELWAYNEDAFPHTLHIMFDLALKVPGPAPVQQPLPADQISSGAIGGI